MIKSVDKIRLGSHCPPILGADGYPVLRLPDGWQGLDIEETVVPARAECGPQYSGVPTLIIGINANVQRWYRSGCRTLHLDAPPPAFDVLSSTYERDHGRWEGEEGRCLKVSLTPQVVERFLPESGGSFDLETRFSAIDSQLRTTVLDLAQELKAGLPNGLMYAEGLSLMVMGWLNAHYRKRGCLETKVQKLSARQQQRLDDYIEDYLDTNISVDDLASLVNISPSHFFLLFRSSFGMTPHQYVMKKRIDRVARLLRAEPERSISDIAVVSGFSSQAHMTKVFKRLKQQTPSRWKTKLS